MGNNNKLVSIIVPVYNIEQYIERCIRSILSQTYNQIEVILIDDGSKDKSGDICDKYAQEDSRVRVFHKENGGVSSARNLGLKEAHGRYIGFVDGDDYISSEMYQKLIELIEKYDADISIVGFANESSDGKFQRYCETEGEILLSQHEQMECLLKNKYFSCSCCDKLFKKELVTGLQLDETITNYEDLKFCFEAMGRSEKAVFISEPYYYYCSNNDSATTSRFNKKKMSMIDVWDGIIIEVEDKYPKLVKCARTEYVRNNLMCAHFAALDEYLDSEDISRIRSNIKKNVISYVFSYAAFGYKIQAITISVSYRLFVSREKRRAK